MLDALLEQRDDVRIVHPVIDLLTIAPRGDEVDLSQSTHVMRYRRFGDPYQSSQHADDFLATE